MGIAIPISPVSSRCQMGATKPSRPSQQDVEALQHLSALLHLFHHRNKNQHRRSVWWRHFSVFRRQLNAVTQDIEALIAQPTGHVERVKQKARAAQLEIRIGQRLDRWHENLVSKWQRAFSQIIADGRFAPLGLVLIAALAQACQILKVTARLAELAEAEMEKALGDFEQEYWGSSGATDQRVNPVQEDSTAKTGHQQEDVGVSVSRDELSIEKEDPIADLDPVTRMAAEVQQRTIDPARKRRGSPPAKAPLRKKRVKVDAIDDLFSGL